MDPRVEEHAEILVDHSTEIEEGDMVTVSAPSAAEDLKIAVFEKIGERGGMPAAVDLSLDGDRAMSAYVDAIDLGSLQTFEHLVAMVEASDVLIGIQAASNVSELSSMDPEAMQAYAKANKPLQDEVLMEDKRWVGTQYPTAAVAQRAEMGTAAYEDFVYEAVSVDWDAQREFQEQLVEILEPASDVRIVSGEETDLTMSIDGNPAVNDFAEKNLPGGEVFTAPLPDSVQGTVLFDKPVIQMGREVTDAYLEFESGEVVSHHADSNQDVLSGLLETDPGSNRVGELGIGMNRAIDRFTYNMLFDEKMGDTMHLALGTGYKETVGDGNERNESAQHVDMIVDMSEDSFIEVDGEVIQENGTFVFEEQAE